MLSPIPSRRRSRRCPTASRTWRLFSRSWRPSSIPCLTSMLLRMDHPLTIIRVVPSNNRSAAAVVRLTGGWRIPQWWMSLSRPHLLSKGFPSQSTPATCSSSRCSKWGCRPSSYRPRSARQDWIRLWSTPLISLSACEGKGNYQ